MVRTHMRTPRLTNKHVPATPIQQVYFSKTKDVISSLRPGRGPVGGVAMHGLAGGGLAGLSEALKRRQQEVEGK